MAEVIRQGVALEEFHPPEVLLEVKGDVFHLYVPFNERNGQGEKVRAWSKEVWQPHIPPSEEELETLLQRTFSFQSAEMLAEAKDNLSE